MPTEYVTTKGEFITKAHLEGRFLMFAEPSDIHLSTHVFGFNLVANERSEPSAASLIFVPYPHVTPLSEVLRKRALVMLDLSRSSNHLSIALI